MAAIAIAVLACMLLGSGAEAAGAASLPVVIKVIYAHNESRQVDPALVPLVKELTAVPFTGFALKDQATLSLELTAVGRMQLPNDAWLAIKPLSLEPDGRLRLELEVKKLKFRTIAAIAPGATLAVGGPAFEQGTLILAVTRPAPSTPAP